jgi:hypothetical protein
MRETIAYVLWAIAALCMLAMPVVGSKRFYRRTSLPVVEGWQLLTAAVVLCVVGAVVDVA